MVHYKIILLIVSISVVCFSADINPEEKALRRRRADDSTEEKAHQRRRADESTDEKTVKLRQAADLCKIFLTSTFIGITVSTIGCIQHAIKSMKLYGNYSYIYEYHVQMYYKLFYNSVHLKSVILPEKFCEYKGEGCAEQLQIFLEPPIFPDGEEQTIEGTSGASSSQMTSGASSSQSINTIDLLKRNVLKNALYFHIIVDPSKEIYAPNDDEAKKYFHDYTSFGYSYLAEIARVIQFKKDSLSYPAKFCYELYFKPKNDS